MPDYRALLVKYMQLIKDEESITYLHTLAPSGGHCSVTSFNSDLTFTPEEYSQLLKIEAELK